MNQSISTSVKYGLTLEEINGLTKNQQDELNNKLDYVIRGAPINWLEYADSLKLHGDIIIQLDNSTVHSATSIEGRREDEKKYKGGSFSYIFLICLSIENLLKGIAIYKNPILMTSGNLNNNKIKSHDLEKLYMNLSLSLLNKEEIKLLKNLQNSITSWGRYPVPLRYNIKTERIIFTEELKKGIDNIYQKLYKHLEELCIDVWEVEVL